MRTVRLVLQQPERLQGNKEEYLVAVRPDCGVGGLKRSKSLPFSHSWVFKDGSGMPEVRSPISGSRNDGSGKREVRMWKIEARNKSVILRWR